VQVPTKTPTANHQVSVAHSLQEGQSTVLVLVISSVILLILLIFLILLIPLIPLPCFFKRIKSIKGIEDQPFTVDPLEMPFVDPLGELGGSNTIRQAVFSRQFLNSYSGILAKHHIWL